MSHGLSISYVRSILAPGPQLGLTSLRTPVHGYLEEDFRIAGLEYRYM